MAYKKLFQQIPEKDRTPVVIMLMEIIKLQDEQIQMLKDEIAQLKGNKPKPKIKPSKLNKSGKGSKDKTGSNKRAGSAKKKKDVIIHETSIIPVSDVPDGSVFKGFEDFTVQGLLLKAHNIRYRRERWLTLEGKTLIAALPKNILCIGGHYDEVLVGFILYQYYHAHVTQPLILEQIREYGVDMSSGKINQIITEGHDYFHREKDQILQAGLEVSSYINVDDTGARHQGKNGYCTHIGNELFAWYQSTGSKSRINFMQLLRGTHLDYIFCDDALDYMQTQKLSQTILDKLKSKEPRAFDSISNLKNFLETCQITQPRHIQIITEGGLLGSIIKHGFNPKCVIVSDDAGQFNIFLHALCWVHAERAITKLHGFNEKNQILIDEVRSQIWSFYQELKAFKLTPSNQRKLELDRRFEDIFTQKTSFASLNQALKRIYKNKSELLLVLERPEIPLHNNLSENDIREYVKKRKISGSTRSHEGRRCRDTFTSLKKTCRKLGISFWEFLHDRLTQAGTIPMLPDLIRQKAGILS